MERGGISIWPMAAAWSAAVEVTAVAYGVPPEVIAAESRGRGPRPPREVWQAKKMAVHLAIVLGQCDYAALGRQIGLHRDTVASHCAWVRDSEDEGVGALATSLQCLAANRLALSGTAGREPSVVVDQRRINLTGAHQIAALENYFGGLLEQARGLLSVDRQTSSDTSDTSRIRDHRPRNAA